MRAWRDTAVHTSRANGNAYTKREPPIEKPLAPTIRESPSETRTSTANLKTSDGLMAQKRLVALRLRVLVSDTSD